METVYIATALLGVVYLYFTFITRLREWQQKLN